VDRVALVNALWSSFSSGNVDALSAGLVPDAKWRAVEDGPWNCESRAAIIDVLTRQREAGTRGQIKEAFEVGERVIVAFRPDGPDGSQWPLEDGLRYLVVTFEGEQVTELKGCATRDTALAYTVA
jgi:hypothetical protein